MARSSAYTYDPKTGSWSQSESTTSTSGSKVTPTNNTTNTSTSGNANLTSTTADKDSSAGSVEKEYNEIELNTLSGTLTFIATEETIKIKVGDTITLKGLGSSLSGNYYVQDINRKVSSSGYSHSATVIRTDFGKSLKVNTATQQALRAQEKTVASTPSSSNAQRTYTVKRGDSLWKIAKQFYGNGALYTKIYDANTKKIANPSLIYPGQVFVIP